MSRHSSDDVSTSSIVPANEAGDAWRRSALRMLDDVWYSSLGPMEDIEDAERNDGGVRAA